MASTACSKALGLPELLNLFSPYLGPAELLACVQVNNLWHQIFIPVLWHTIDDSLQSWERILFTCHSKNHQYGTRIRMKRSSPSNITDGKDESWIRGIFKKYGQHIRRLKLRWIILVDAAGASRACTNLLDLDIDIEQSNGENLYWSRKSRNVGQGHGAALRDQEDLRDQTTMVERLETKFSDITQPMFEGVFEPPEKFQQLIRGSLTVEELKEGLIFTQNYWTLVLDNPGLQRLRLSRKAILQWSVRSDEFFYRILSGMKGLKEVDVVEFLALSNVWDLHDVVPNVEKIAVVRGNSLSKRNGSTGVESKNTPPRPNPSIKTLRVGQDHYPRFPIIPQLSCPRNQDTIMILSLLPNLQDLTLASIRIGDSVSLFPSHLPAEAMVPDFPVQGFGLKTLHISQCDNLVPLLRYLPNLRVLKVNTMKDDVLESLAIYCKHLEVLEWMRNPAFIDEILHRRPQQDGLHRFLVSCSTLKVFNGIERYVKADDMIREPWGCQRIEKLRFRIVGIERLTQDEQAIYDRVVAARTEAEGTIMELTDEERAVVHKFERGREQQQQVYERLGNLRLLKHLDLGFENRNPRQWRYGGKYVSKVDGEYYQRYGGPIPDTLELSLESGLSQLETLKNLEMFGFEGVNHHIEKRELEWMAKSWPKLRMMYGLAEDRLPMIEPDRKKADLRKYMERLRLDVKHDSLYVDPDLR